MERLYDVLIVGGGPGGYTAALYCARAGLRCVVLEKLSAGGQMALTERIDNYPGFPEGVGGFELGEKMRRGAERFGAETVLAEVTALRLAGAVKTAESSEGPFRGRALILATGAEPRPLGLPGERELAGRGVHYCAACDGMAYRGKTAAVVGGGNSAVGDALLLSRLCERVCLIHRRDTLRADKVYHAPLEQAENVELLFHSSVSALLYGERLTGLRLRDTRSGAERTLPCDGVFVSIGRTPATALLRGGGPALDEAGYVVADESTRSSLPGVFAVGDVRGKALRQIVTAAADGAAAAHYAEEYLARDG